MPAREKPSRRSGKRATTAVKYISGSVATAKRKGICEQKEEWTGHHHNSQRAGSPRESRRPSETAEPTFRRKFAYPEKERCRNETEYRQQRQDRAKNTGDSPFCHSPMMRCQLAARLNGMFRICISLCKFRAVVVAAVVGVVVVVVAGWVERSEPHHPLRPAI
jgi:hypothetical protein